VDHSGRPIAAGKPLPQVDISYIKICRSRFSCDENSRKMITGKDLKPGVPSRADLTPNAFASYYGAMTNGNENKQTKEKEHHER
jgi:hypothetical protein